MERKLYSSILANLKRKEYIIITGARQVGKTTILKQISKFLKEQNEVHYFLTFENPDILNLVNDHPANILQFTGVGSPSREAESGKKITLLIDEVQYHKNPSNFLKYHYDVNGDWLKIVATGSSAFYLDTKFKDSLAGRKKIFELFVNNITARTQLFMQNMQSAMPQPEQTQGRAASETSKGGAKAESKKE